MKQRVRYETFDPDGQFKIQNFHLYQLLTSTYITTATCGCGTVAVEILGKKK